MMSKSMPNADWLVKELAKETTQRWGAAGLQAVLEGRPSSEQEYLASVIAKCRNAESSGKPKSEQLWAKDLLEDEPDWVEERVEDGESIRGRSHNIH